MAEELLLLPHCTLNTNVPQPSHKCDTVNHVTVVVEWWSIETARTLKVFIVCLANHKNTPLPTHPTQQDIRNNVVVML